MDKVKITEQQAKVISFVKSIYTVEDCISIHNRENKWRAIHHKCLNELSLEQFLLAYFGFYEVISPEEEIKEKYYSEKGKTGYSEQFCSGIRFTLEKLNKTYILEEKSNG